jgi:hypothetical protein
MTRAIKLPDTGADKAEEIQMIQEMHDYATLGEAVRHMCREGG